MSLTWRTGSRRLRAPHVSCLSNADNALVSPHQSFNRQCSDSSKSYFLSFLVARTKHNYLCLQYCNSIVLAVFYSILYLNAIQCVCWCISMFHCIGRLAHWHNPIQSWTNMYLEATKSSEQNQGAHIARAPNRPNQGMVVTRIHTDSERLFFVHLHIHFYW